MNDTQDQADAGGAISPLKDTAVQPVPAAPMVVAATVASAPPMSPAPHGPQLADSDFAVLLLIALVDMAARSKRGQADLVAAMRGASLTAEPRRVRAALRLLQGQGAIDNLVPLSDGDILLSVTQAGNEYYGGVSQWLPLDAADEAAD